MACNCIETSKEKILAKLAEMHPDWTITESDYENQIFPFSEENNSIQPIILTHHFGFTYTFKKVNGEDSKPRTDYISINPTYCGFCGKKFVEEAEDDPDTIFDHVRKLNAISAKKDGSKFTVLLHSNGSPNTLTIWLHMGELKRSIAVGLERSVIVSILKTLTDLYSNEL